MGFNSGHMVSKLEFGMSSEKGLHFLVVYALVASFNIIVLSPTCCKTNSRGHCTCDALDASFNLLALFWHAFIFVKSSK